MMEVEDHEFESQSDDANSENGSSDSEDESKRVGETEVERVMFTQYDMYSVFQLIII